ncbi:hypothetical protein RAAC3_TM7C00001G0332 [Candidatus Saccharibacteria bacterium RAAC3_TM7_1]|nr:hypothetical protein RAAC3_TM7C00001G0332 [Candidatus Saccharibacteria bacterium RAAC3_TM7_1]
MKRRFTTLTLVAAMTFGVASMVPAASAGAINVFDSCSTGTSDSEICKAKNESINPVVQNIINLLLWAIGLISVIMIIIGGIRYTMSNGDANMVRAAKDTVMYAVIGLVVAILAYAIVNFVVTWFK